MTPFQVYKLYVAVKIHFTSEKYDIFERRGAVKCTEEGFHSVRGKGRFDQLARNVLKEPRDAVQFFVANQAYETNIFEHAESMASWVRWQRNKEMMTQLVLDDIHQLQEHHFPWMDVFKGEFPDVIKLVNRREINLETLVVLDRFYHFSSEPNWKNNLIYPKISVKLNKLQKFITVNETSIMRALNEHSLA